MPLIVIPPPQRPHEVVAAFERLALPLAPVLRAMLDEERQHLSPRRGCGYTQSWRFLADIVNQPRSLAQNDLHLFAAGARPRLLHLVKLAERELGRMPHGLREVRAALSRCDEPGAHEGLELLEAVDALPSEMSREESRLFVRSMLTVLDPEEQAEDVCRLPPHPEKLPIGTCPEAERFFLELAGRYVRRGGEINVFVDEENRPILVEKMKIGDSHSCLALEPIRIQGVWLPPGSLLGADYEESVEGYPEGRHLPGRWVPITHVSGFRFLRLTTLALPPELRVRAFTTHVKRQMAGSGYFDPLETKLSELREVAEAQRPASMASSSRKLERKSSRTPRPATAGAEKSLAVVYSPRYVAPARVPSMRKLKWVAEALEGHSGLEFIHPEPVERDFLEELHDPAYVDAFLAGTWPLAQSQNLAWSEDLVASVLLSVGGQLLGAQRAMQDGMAFNLAHGFHHARYSRGAGYCTFNGLAAVALANPGLRVAVLDCDEHPGDGTAEFSERLTNLYNVSIHGHSTSFPCESSERCLILSLPSSAGGEGYHAALEEAFAYLRTVEPDLLIYQAGVDCHRDDPLNSLGLSDADIVSRDRAVFRWAADRALPILTLLAGGYLEREQLTRLHVSTFESCLRERREDPVLALAESSGT